MSGSGGPALDPAQPAPPGDVPAPAPIPNRPPEPVNVLPTAPPPAELRLGSLVLEPPVTDELLAIPLATRRLVSTSLDLLTRPDAGLRSASFYIGFLMLVTVGPFATLYVAILLGSSIDPIAAEARTPPWWGHLFATGVIAMLGYLAASVEARTLATAVLGGRVEGRPLRLRESIAIARRRFWRVAIVEFVVQFAATIVQLVVLFGLAAARVPIDVVSFPLGVIVGLVIGTPFVYATAGIVLGEVTAFDSLVRSFRLVRARFRLAIVVTLFGVLSQLIVTFGLGSGLDVVARLAVGAGVDESFPVALAVLIAAALVFAVGTLTFLVEAIAAAPAVHAFAALTHYARGLEVGRQAPLGVRHVWDPYVSRPLAIGIAIAVAALLLGLTATPG